MYVVYENHEAVPSAQADGLAAWGWDAFFEAAFATLGLPEELLARSAAGRTERGASEAAVSGGRAGDEDEAGHAAALEGALDGASRGRAAGAAAGVDLSAGGVRARILEARRSGYLLVREDGPVAVEDQGILSGRLKRLVREGAEAPTVGDWVIGRKEPGGPFVIEGLLPRRSVFSRKAPGDAAHDRVREQAMAANVDYAFLVSAAGADFSARRLERYAGLAWESGAQPVIVITKADLAGDAVLELVEEAKAACPGAPAFAVAALEGKGLAAFSPYLRPGKTAVLLGSSGAGKSTILNALSGERRAETKAVRSYDERGRHTTTARTLYRLPSGGMIIDTPGLREVQLWAERESVDAVFPEIEDASSFCRFSDCSHGSEPGCEVRVRLESGEIAQDRFDSWLKLRKELAFLAARDGEGREALEAMQARKARHKEIGKFQKELKRARR